MQHGLLVRKGRNGRTLSEEPTRRPGGEGRYTTSHPKTSDTTRDGPSSDTSSGLDRRLRS